MTAMDKVLEQTLLYDFYGELLTENQKRIYEDIRFGDLSLSEVAQASGISRQGVHDMLRRTEKALCEYEEKLGLVARFRKTNELADRIRHLVRQFEDTSDASLVEEIGRISAEIGEL